MNANAGLTKPNLVDAHVLLVEDDPTVAAALLELLRLFGCRPAHARNATKAREAIASTKCGFDAAVIDLSLPDGSGASLVPMLHGSPLPCAALLVSGLPGAIAGGLALAAEAHDLVSKPLAATEFAARLSNTVSATVSLRHGRPVRDIMLAEFDEGRALASANEAHHDRDMERSRSFFVACHRFSCRHQLTPAQVRVLPALIAGYDEDDIAELLVCPIAEVRRHARDIVQRLHLRDRSDLPGLFRSTYAGTGPWPSRTTSISSSKNRNTVEGSGHR